MRRYWPSFARSTSFFSEKRKRKTSEKQRMSRRGRSEREGVNEEGKGGKRRRGSRGRGRREQVGKRSGRRMRHTRRIVVIKFVGSPRSGRSSHKLHSFIEFKSILEPLSNSGRITPTLNNITTYNHLLLFLLLLGWWKMVT